MSIGAGLAMGQYYPGTSVVHRTDARVKLILVFLNTIALLLVDTFSGFAVEALMFGALVVVAGLPVKLVLRGLRPLFYILFISVFFQLISGGAPYIAVGPLSVSEPGLLEGALLGIRILLLVIGASFLTLTSTPVELIDGVEYLLSPLKRLRVPVHELSMMMTIALRFIPTLSSEADKVIRAQAARGAKFESGNPLVRARSFIPVLIPLFMSVFRRADELAEAMEARAYRGGEGRTRLRGLEASPRDAVAFGIGLLALSVVVWIGRMPVI